MRWGDSTAINASRRDELITADMHRHAKSRAALIAQAVHNGVFHLADGSRLIRDGSWWHQLPAQAVAS